MFINREQFNFDNDKKLKIKNSENPELLKKLDSDGDNQISTKELASIFDEIDTNQDKNITKDEITNAAKKYNTSLDHLVNLFTELKNGIFKVKGDTSKSNDKVILTKENGAQIITSKDGTTEIISPKETKTINGGNFTTYTRTILNKDGSSTIEKISESIEFGNKSCTKTVYNSSGDIISTEQADSWGGSSAKEIKNGNKTTVSSSVVNPDTFRLISSKAFSYKTDSNGDISNVKDGNIISINTADFDKLFDKNGKFNKNIEFPITMGVCLKIKNNTAKTIEIKINGKDAISASSPAFNGINDKKMLEYLCGQITNSISEIPTEALNDLLAEVNTIEIAYDSDLISGRSQGEYQQGTDSIRLHTKGAGFSTGTIIHELGHAIDDRLGNFESKKMQNSLEKFKTNSGFETNSHSTYGLTNTREYFAEYYTYKYSRESLSNQLFRNSNLADNKDLKELNEYCEQMLTEIRSGNLKRKQDYVQIKSYNDNILQAFILEHYDQLNNITPISTPRELKTAISSNPQIKEYYSQNIAKFADTMS